MSVFAFLSQTLAASVWDGETPTRCEYREYRPQIFIVIEMQLETSCGTLEIRVTRNEDGQGGSVTIQSESCGVDVHINFITPPDVSPSPESEKIKVLFVKPSKGSSEADVAEFQSSPTYIAAMNAVAEELNALGKL